MAYTQGLCSRAQLSIINVMGNNAPSIARQKTGGVDGLMSNANRAGFLQNQINTDGKTKIVQINWQPQACDSDVVTTCTPNCTPTITPEPKEDLISSFLCAKYPMTFSETEMRKMCQGTDEAFIATNIYRAMNAINVSVDKAILALLLAGVGETAGGAAELSIPLFTAAGTPNPMAYAQILNEFEALGASGSPILVGGQMFDLYAKAQQIACCNSTAGIDLSQIQANGYFYSDPSINSVDDPTTTIGWLPGAAQLVTWNKYVGEYAVMDKTFEHGTIVDPITGLKYDLKRHYDDCAETWFVELSLNWRLWMMPKSSLCANADSNLILKMVDCSAGVVPCPAP